MVFGADEVRVVRRALALALLPGPARADDVRDCLRLSQAVDAAVDEAARLRAFLVADLARYRAALPGSLAGFLPLLAEALDAGYQPGPDDLAALRALRHEPAAARLLARCQALAEQAVRARLAGRALAPGPRTPLRALPGGRAADEPAKPAPAKPAPAKPATPARKPDQPARRPGAVPTPAEVFPPKRRPSPPGSRYAFLDPDLNADTADTPPQKLAAG
ncbi:hypothetical protein ABZV64_14300 [Streptomyces sp. NPDC004959]|uniref:hypothetical protein n=1 Tax=unclassified Streptomyces TaxID=2593676 RepID=UPI0033B1ACB3